MTVTKGPGFAGWLPVPCPLRGEGSGGPSSLRSVLAPSPACGRLEEGALLCAPPEAAWD